MRAYSFSNETFSRLAELAEKNKRVDLQKFIKNEMVYAGFELQEGTEWARCRVQTVVEDGWQSAQHYFDCKPGFRSTEQKRLLGVIYNRIIGGCSENEEHITMAAFVFYYTTERSRVAA